MNCADLFKRKSMPIAGGGFKAVQVAVCGGCGKEATIDDHHAGPMPPSAVAAKFRQRGWKIASRRSGDRCPSCARKPPRPELSPGQRRAAWCRIEGVPRGAEARGPQAIADKIEEGATMTPRTVHADPPREPRAEDRKQVREALFEHYDEEARRYRESWSDAALAAKLMVPRKWVSDLREAMGLGPDENAAAEKRAAELAAIKALVAEAQDLALKSVEKSDEAERRLKRFEMAADYAGGRA